MKNPKSSRKPNNVTKRTKEIKTERTSILFENLSKNIDIDAGANHLQIKDRGIISCNVCQTDVLFGNSKRRCVGKKHQGKYKILINKKVQARQTLVTLKSFEREKKYIQGQSLLKIQRVYILIL